MQTFDTRRSNQQPRPASSACLTFFFAEAMSTEFRTTDVDLAAFLSCREQRVKTVVPPDGPPWIAEFVFDSTPALENVVADWSSDDSSRRLVDALEFSKRRVRLYRWARNIVDEATGKR